VCVCVPITLGDRALLRIYCPLMTSSTSTAVGSSTLTSPNANLK